MLFHIDVEIRPSDHLNESRPRLESPPLPVSIRGKKLNGPPFGGCMMYLYDNTNSVPIYISSSSLSSSSSAFLYPSTSLLLQDRVRSFELRWCLSLQFGVRYSVVSGRLVGYEL